MYYEEKIIMFSLYKCVYTYFDNILKWLNLKEKNYRTMPELLSRKAHSQNVIMFHHTRDDK